MVVVVTDAVLVAGSRPGRLDAPEQALVDQNAEGVVDALTRDRTNLGSDGLGNVVCRTVRSIGHRPQDGQPLGRDLYTALAEKIGLLSGWMHGHGHIIGQILILSNVVPGPCIEDATATGIWEGGATVCGLVDRDERCSRDQAQQPM